MNKQLQWTLAGGLLCLMVFGITFFMNYVGDPNSGGGHSGAPPGYVPPADEGRPRH